MTKEKIMALAAQAGFREWHPHVVDLIALPSAVERFAALVAERERELCAKVCESLPLEWPDQPNVAQAERATLMDCAAAIRARSQP
jgi:hypothetical protein